MVLSFFVKIVTFCLISIYRVMSGSNYTIILSINVLQRVSLAILLLTHNPLLVESVP